MILCLLVILETTPIKSYPDDCQNVALRIWHELTGQNGWVKDNEASTPDKEVQITEESLQGKKIANCHSALKIFI